MSRPDRRVIFRGKKVDLALQADASGKSREVVLHPGAVALLPMVDADHVCLLKVHRFAVDRTLIEVPAGTLDVGESPEATAVRELREETGYTAGRIVKLVEWWVSPGVMTERMHLFMCSDLSPGPTDHQPDERIEPMAVDWDEAVAMVHDGRIEDAKSMLAILIGDRVRIERSAAEGLSPRHSPSNRDVPGASTASLK